MKNTDNLEKINLQQSQIGNFLKTINEKDELIKKLKSNYVDNEKKIQVENEIKELIDENKLLLKENKELKQSNILLKKSTNEQTINNVSLKEYIQRVKDLEDENFLLKSLLDENKKKSLAPDEISNSVNFLYEEENNRIKNENEKLKLKIEKSENENFQLKTQNDELKKKIEIMNIKDIKESKNLAESNISNFEEEFDIKDLEKNIKKRNKSEDIQIDSPGTNDVNSKKIEELKELIKYIISRFECDDSDLQEKVKRVCEILEIE